MAEIHLEGLVNDPDDIVAVEFLRLAAQTQSVRELTWYSTGSPGDLDFDEVVFEFIDSKGKPSLIGKKNDILVYCSSRYGSITLGLAGWFSDDFEKVIEWAKSKVPVTVAIDQMVPMKFWFHTPDGPESATREIKVPTKEEIHGNYAESTWEGLAKLYQLHAPSGGQLILWHGFPGTGKTYALRALAWEWREWVDTHYVIDPDSFFGSHPSDLMRVVLDSSEDDKWKLLILEDTGELLTIDAKDKEGQALSRLLNLVDGLIGQGLKLMVLITTNEEIKNMQPALIRPGRCMALVKFDKLDIYEVEAWLKRHDIDMSAPGERTLAQVFALADRNWEPEQKLSVGFTG